MDLFLYSVSFFGFILGGGCNFLLILISLFFNEVDYFLQMHNKFRLEMNNLAMINIWPSNNCYNKTYQNRKESNMLSDSSVIVTMSRAIKQ